MSATRSRPGFSRGLCRIAQDSDPVDSNLNLVPRPHRRHTARGSGTHHIPREPSHALRKKLGEKRVAENHVSRGQGLQEMAGVLGGASETQSFRSGRDHSSRRTGSWRVLPGPMGAGRRSGCCRCDAKVPVDGADDFPDDLVLPHALARVVPRMETTHFHAFSL